MRYVTLSSIIVIAFCVFLHGVRLANAAKPVQRLLIVEDSQQAAANNAAMKVFGPKARDTFSVRMEDTGKKAYFVCSWRLTDEDTTRLKAELNKIAGKKLEILTKVAVNPKATEFTNVREKLKEKDLKPKPNMAMAVDKEKK